jgi:hypothetical protein
MSVNCDRSRRWLVVVNLAVLAIVIPAVIYGQATRPSFLDPDELNPFERDTTFVVVGTPSAFVATGLKGDATGLNVISLNGTPWTLTPGVDQLITEANTRAAALRTLYHNGASTFTPRGGFFASVDYSSVATGQQAPVRSTVSDPAIEDLAYPRYTALETGATSVVNIVAANTMLLIPYAVAEGAFDTGIALRNTTADPFGPSTGAPPNGSPVRLDFFPRDVPAARVPDGPVTITLDLGLFGGGTPSPPITVNPETTQAAPADEKAQTTVATLAYMDNAVVMSRATPTRSLDWRSLFAGLAGATKTRSALGAGVYRTSWRHPVGTAATPTPTAPHLKVFVTSLGTLGANAFRMVIVNESGAPIALRLGDIALEPVARLTEKDVQRELAKLARFPQRTLTAPGYCLQREKDAPAPGMVYRLAPADAQAKNAPLSRVLRAAKRLRDGKALNPDTDPDDYFHSVVQWAIWTEQEKFDQRAFAAAFTAYTRKNIVSGGERWTRDLEDAVRGIASDRWRDVSRIVDEARKEPSTGTIK